MLNSSIYTDSVEAREWHSPYDTEIEIFEKLCGGCPFALMKITEILIGECKVAGESK